jgi:hypothetical protein
MPADVLQRYSKVLQPLLNITLTFASLTNRLAECAEQIKPIGILQM